MWSARLILLVLAFSAAAVRGQSQVCTQPVTLGIAIDESGSIASADFTTVKNQIASFITSTSVTTPANQYYFNVFSSTVRSPMPALAENSGDSVAALVRGLVQQSGTTNMNAALDDLRSKLPTGAIAVLFTDGIPDDRPATTAAAAALKTKGITLIAIGVGTGTNKAYLTSIASPGFAFFDNAFANLNAKLNEALVVACPCPACTNTCSVKVIGESTSTNELAINRTMARDVRAIAKFVCQDVNEVLPAGFSIKDQVDAMANTTAIATANAVAKVVGELFFKGNCDPGTNGNLRLNATAVAWANVTAEAYAEAVAMITKNNALAGLDDFVNVTATALASSCQRAIVSATEDKFFQLTVGTSYPDWTKVAGINKTATVSAVAKAIAEAYATAIARFSLTAKQGELKCSARCLGCKDIIVPSP